MMVTFIENENDVSNFGILSGKYFHFGLDNGEIFGQPDTAWLGLPPAVKSDLNGRVNHSKENRFMMNIMREDDPTSPTTAAAIISYLLMPPIQTIQWLIVL